MKIFTWFGKETLLIFTDALCQLLFTGWMTEIGRRSAHIMDITFKIRVPGKCLRFINNRFMAPGLDNSSLMKSKGAETAAAKTAPVAHQTEFDLFNGRNTAGRLIGRVIGPHIIQTVDPVHLRRRQRFCRRILNNIEMFSIAFHHTLTTERVRINVLSIKTFRIFSFTLCDILKRRETNGVIDRIQRFCLVDRTRHECNVPDIQTAVQSICHFHDRTFTHTVK